MRCMSIYTASIGVSVAYKHIQKGTSGCVFGFFFLPNEFPETSLFAGVSWLAVAQQLPALLLYLLLELQ